MEPRPLDRDLQIALARHSSFISTALGGDKMIAHYPRNTTGRDFIVGDIHGMFPKLEEILQQLSFDAQCDRLFAVGDLIDRGPRSELAGHWLRQPWFHSARGNHDQFLLDAMAHGGNELTIWHHNGGDWYYNIENGDEVLADCNQLFRDLPLLMEIETGDGTVGIVHADVPEDRTWETFKAALQAGERADCTAAMWNRRRVNHAMRFQQLGATVPLQSVAPVAGDLRCIVCGHARLTEVLPTGNMLIIDTGAAYASMSRPRFSMLQIEPGERKLFEFLTWENDARVTEIPLPVAELP